jgi:hypothetical protein
MTAQLHVIDVDYVRGFDIQGYRGGVSDLLHPRPHAECSSADIWRSSILILPDNMISTRWLQTAVVLTLGRRPVSWL